MGTPVTETSTTAASPGEVDVCIVGSGAGGGTLAYALAEAGVRVVVLEKGPRYDARDFAYHDELKVIKHDFFTPLADDEPHLFREPGGESYQKTRNGWLACCVGGGTVHMSGFFMRMHRVDLQMKTRFGNEALSTVEDWPITYEELEPWYDRIEYILGVGGHAGQNPFDERRRVPYPMPPIAEHPFTAPFDKAAKRLGWHPYSTPRAVLSRAYGGRPPCNHCGYCGSYGCEIGAKSSVLAALIPRAEATGKCTIIPEAMAAEIAVGADGRAQGVRYLDANGAMHEQRARVVVVSCTAIESARLLLNSRSNLFPHGAGNSTGQVGRNLIFGTYSSIEADFHRRGKAKAFPGFDDQLPFLGRSIQDFYLPKPKTGIPKGGTLRFDMMPRAPIGRLVKVAITRGGGTPDVPIWGKKLKDEIRAHLRDMRTLECEVFAEHTPSTASYLDVDDATKDKYGLGVARMTVGVLETNVRANRFLSDRATELYREMGADEIRTTTVGGVSWVLQHGTCRFGKDPRTSALDPSCRTHDIPNLYVVDGSFMPTSGGVPTTLTIQANALRVASLITGALARREL